MSKTASTQPAPVGQGNVRPNILFVLVDELRYPVHFPEGVHSADEFIARFMPNTWRLLWSPGVVFHDYATPASDCTPARAAIATGLYAQQTRCVATRANPLNAQGTGAPQPALDPAFPTYGKVLREAGYDTPYIGKWHLSNFPASYASSAAPWYLREYGFEGLTLPDPLGLQGQGVGATPAMAPPVGSAPVVSDAQIATAAVTWMAARAAQTDARPFCLTVSLVNPHDKQWFWGGIEASQYNKLYAEADLKPLAVYTFDVVWQTSPPALGYRVPDNWQAGPLSQEPTLHEVFRKMTNGLMGGIATDSNQTTFAMGPNAISAIGHTASAPYSYWTKGLDMYTQAISDVDVQVGHVIQNIPEALRQNMVVIFTSDHGEYAGSHGMQGKGMSVYQETMHVPFCLTDLSGRLGAVPGARTQPGSHVDLLPLFANLAYGDSSWMKLTAWRGMYEGRNDLLAIARDPEAAVVRPYNLFSSDEPIPAVFNFLKAPEHVLSYITPEHKLGLYSYWAPGAMTPAPHGQQLEYFDYREDPRRLELNSAPHRPEAQALRDRMLEDYLPNEMQAPLPAAYQAAQDRAMSAYWQYIDLMNVGMAVAVHGM